MRPGQDGTEEEADPGGPVTDIAILLVTLLAGAIVLWPKLAHRPRWRAMITPLASIIGSGFLVLGPVLDASFGGYAPLVMAGLCAMAWAFGAAIRFNMAEDDPDLGTDPLPLPHLETAASWALAFSYIISVAYYLNLFGAFAVSLTPFDSRFWADTVTTAMFLVILGIGWSGGFRVLERVEYLSVTVKLAIIAGLLTGLGGYFWSRATAGALVFIAPERTGWNALTLAFGLIITVQGFETSRYLGASYDTRTRIASMKLAQALSSAIYMVYVVLLAYVFARSELKLTETAIIDMMRVVSPILPGMLVAAALAAQFSAAIADTSGAGGLFAEVTRRRLSPRKAYALLAACGIALTWSANVFEIINYASRAFAGYYALQALIAAAKAHARHRFGPRTLGFAALALLGAAIVVFGQAAGA